MYSFLPATSATTSEAKENVATCVTAMRHATQAFKDTIAPLAVGANIQDPLVVIHAIILLASIRLDTAPSWTKASVENALAAVALVDDATFGNSGHVYPILGFLLVAIGQVLIDELIRIRGLVSKSEEDAQREMKVKNAADRLDGVLRACGADCPYICELYARFVVFSCRV